MSGGAARAWIDGAARGNPGEAGFGAILEHPGGREEIGGYLGRTTNNVAEYVALVALLGRAAALGLGALEIASDSELVVRQLAGRYKGRAPHLQRLFRAVQSLRAKFSRLHLRHVPREENRAADRLANQAIDERWPLPPWLDRTLLEEA